MRYCDFVILGTRRVRTEEARGRVGEILRPLRLQLNPDKTNIVLSHQGCGGV